MFPAHLQSKVLQALKSAHPYEEVAYYLHPLDNDHQESRLRYDRTVARSHSRNGFSSTPEKIHGPAGTETYSCFG